MSIFSNKNFITQIIRQQGATDYIDSECLLVLQALIEAQTRKMVQRGTRYMNNDHRDNLTSNDIQNAIKDLGHQDLCHLHLHVKQPQFHSQATQYLLSDPTFRDLIQFSQQQQKSLTTFSSPTLKGRYIYLNKKVPKTNENHQLKSLQDIKQIKIRQYQEKKRNFNIIRDQPESQLTKEEIQYYHQVINYFNHGKSDDNDIQVKGSVVNLIPIILKFIINLGVNQNCITFILKAIQNKFVSQSLEFNMHQILVILMAYSGPQVFQVGCKIGQIVLRFGQKYQNLYDIFQQLDESSYSLITKKIGFELTTGIALQLSLQKIRQIESQSLKNNLEAIICFKMLIDYWSELKCLRRKQVCQQYGYVYWYGVKEMNDDPYLNMY